MVSVGHGISGPKQNLIELSGLHLGIINVEEGMTNFCMVIEYCLLTLSRNCGEALPLTPWAIVTNLSEAAGSISHGTVEFNEHM